MNKITPEELLQLADDKKFLVIKERLSEENPIDIAGLFGEIPPERVAPFFRLLPKELAADTFVEMDSDMQEKLITGCTPWWTNCMWTIPWTSSRKCRRMW